MKTILLIGATGFLGSYLLEALVKKNYHLIIFKRSSSNIWRISHLMDQIISYDIDKQNIEEAFKHHNMDAIIHTAGCYGRNNESISEVVENNLIYGLKILDCCLKYKTKLFLNTDTLLPKRINPYSLSKKQFVEYLYQYSDKIQIINLIKP